MPIRGKRQPKHSLPVVIILGGISKDESEALKWAQKAADQDHLAGKYTLAMLSLPPKKSYVMNRRVLALLESIMPQIRAEADKGNPSFNPNWPFVINPVTAFPKKIQKNSGS